MLNIKLSEVYIHTIVFFLSIAILFTFLTMASHNEYTEQTYEMTDHQLSEKYVNQQVQYEHSHSNSHAITTTAVSY
ncbi:DNA damage-induced cell division inhibitor SosA [Staphylococcus canis]|uniref:Secreted protein n=1 Tax=Staphylococcus canis TaxID=2724942 RepID=A0ABS0T942_9STAP|nr:DNA damage-induced cell division inhibitor SosA [Staphylococcus canis]MBI5975241.1 hypothetical protein [Staphylococcus canis]